MSGTWSSTDVARLAGVSYRRLDYWARTGAIGHGQRDLGSGQRRRWDSLDIARIRVIGHLADLPMIPGTGQGKTPGIAVGLVKAVYDALAGPSGAWPEWLYLWHDGHEWHTGIPDLGAIAITISVPVERIVSAA